MPLLKKQLLELKDYIRGYKLYSAIISQSGANPPYEDNMGGGGLNVPFEDTINGVWGYDVLGVYTYTKTGAFANIDKVDVLIFDNKSNQGTNVAIRAIVSNANTISFNVGTLTAFNSNILIAADGLLYLQPIEIRVHN